MAGPKVVHSESEMPDVLRQMAKYDPLRRAVLLEAADHIDRLRINLEIAESANQDASAKYDPPFGRGRIRGGSDD